MAELFNPDSENFISLDEVNKNNELTDFMHAIANVVPAMFYCNITGHKVDNLEFNHIANKLCFQYLNKV